MIQMGSMTKTNVTALSQKQWPFPSPGAQHDGR
jgi:hypothetical protein